MPPWDASGGKGPRLGLKSLRERAQLSSGVLTIDSEPGRGTVITVVWDAAALRG